ncbi:hypothetical protein ACFVWY_33860 [Streptomyces sp. NPDC058195]|uniref:hypothetical protein n=1 Tax=Streptomyces sp. NPDC058195 TaxID=3346375 RepID=UPI0036E7C246
MTSITTALRRRRDRRILAALPPVVIVNDERDPDFCWTCMRKCGSQPHSRPGQ